VVVACEVLGVLASGGFRRVREQGLGPRFDLEKVHVYVQEFFGNLVDLFTLTHEGRAGGLYPFKLRKVLIAKTRC